MVNEVMGIVEMVQGMKRLRREEGLGQSPWGPNLVNGPEGGGKRLWRCNIPEKERLGMAAWLAVLAGEISGRPEGI